MTRLLKLAAIAVALIFIVSQGLPWLRQRLARSSPIDLPGGDEDGGVCVVLALDASQEFGHSIRAFARPPIDLPAWSSASERVEAAISEADFACSCIEASCSKASEAVALLRGLLSDFDRGFRGEGSVPLNAAIELKQVDRLLDEASALAREGR